MDASERARQVGISSTRLASWYNSRLSGEIEMPPLLGTLLNLSSDLRKFVANHRKWTNSDRARSSSLLRDEFRDGPQRLIETYPDFVPVHFLCQWTSIFAGSGDTCLRRAMTATWRGSRSRIPDERKSASRQNTLQVEIFQYRKYIFESAI